MKAFGQRNADERGKLIIDLNVRAASHQVALPTSISAAQSDELKKLQRLSGPAFDREYVGFMLRANRDDVARVQQGSQQAQDPNLHAHAAKALPVLQDHVRTAQGLAAQVGAGP